MTSCINQMDRCTSPIPLTDCRHRVTTIRRRSCKSTVFTEFRLRASRRRARPRTEQSCSLLSRISADRTGWLFPRTRSSCTSRSQARAFGCGIACSLTGLLATELCFLTLHRTRHQADRTAYAWTRKETSTDLGLAVSGLFLLKVNISEPSKFQRG